MRAVAALRVALHLTLLFGALFGPITCGLPPAAESPPQPQSALAKEGEACGGADHVACAAGLECHEERRELAPLPQDDKLVSGPGGACGGIAGLHCQEGLQCDMPRDQLMVADGMGTCGFPARCVVSWKKR